jgi:hypothetical protein
VTITGFRRGSRTRCSRSVARSCPSIKLGRWASGRTGSLAEFPEHRRPAARDTPLSFLDRSGGGQASRFFTDSASGTAGLGGLRGRRRPADDRAGRVAVAEYADREPQRLLVIGQMLQGAPVHESQRVLSPRCASRCRARQPRGQSAAPSREGGLRDARTGSRPWRSGGPLRTPGGDWPRGSRARRTAGACGHHRHRVRRRGHPTPERVRMSSAIQRTSRREYVVRVVPGELASVEHLRSNRSISQNGNLRGPPAREQAV